MPQLDLAWFLFNFAIAWTLVIVVLSSLSTQSWNEQTNTEQKTTTNPAHNNQWQW